MTKWLLDTVIISELRKLGRADRQFMIWEKTLSGLDAWISVIALNDISYGIHLIAVHDPKFATQLRDWYRNQLIEQFSARLLIVDLAIAELGAEMRAMHRLSVNDSLIAATAKVQRLNPRHPKCQRLRPNRNPGGESVGVSRETNPSGIASADAEAFCGGEETIRSR